MIRQGATDARTPKLDSHHHFWNYDPLQHGWMNDDMRALRRDFLPPDLKHEIDAAGIDGAVTVQARQSLEETDWLLALAKENDFIRGVVGWVPLTQPNVKDDLVRFADKPKLKAVRHVIQDEPDQDYILRDDFNCGIEALGDFGLAYDILIFERHLPQTVRFVDRHPTLVFILDHVAKPGIKENLLSPWQENISQLAERDNVYCKLSGMATEADYRQWTEEQLTPYMEIVLDAFGPERLMFGSDWPVCLVACGYKRWLAVVQRFISKLSAAEQEAIIGGTAVDAYRLQR